MKTFFVLVVLTLLIAGGIFFWLNPSMLSGLFGGGTPEPVATTTPQASTPLTYASSTLGISVRYPREYILDEAYEYPFSSTKTIPDAVRFTIPQTLATGTNLASDTYISVEQLPRATKCVGDIYVRDNVTSRSLTEGGVNYSLATTSGAAAGNRYEEWVYALSNSKPCTAVRYFLHWGEIGNYATGTVREFDKAGLLRSFDDIRHSLQLRAAAEAPAATTTQP